MTEPTAQPRARAAYDPFAPPAPAFPRARLERAGLDEEQVANLTERWDSMSGRQRRELSAFVTRNADAVVLARFTEPEGGVDQVRAELEAKTRDELKDLLRAQNKPLGGRHAELVDRLLADNVADGQGDSEGDGEQVVGEPVDDDTDGEQAEVEVTHTDGSIETVTGELPTSATQTPDGGTADGQTTNEEAVTDGR